MFLASSTNHSYFLSKSFHASPSAGWLSSFSTGFLFNLCHCTSSAVLLEEKILFSLGINGKCHKTFSGIFFLASLSFHLDALQTGHTSFFLNSSETEHNYLGTHGLNCIRAPNARISLFASWYDAGIEQFGNDDDNNFSIAVNPPLEIR